MFTQLFSHNKVSNVYLTPYLTKERVKLIWRAQIDDSIKASFSLEDSNNFLNCFEFTLRYWDPTIKFKLVYFCFDDVINGEIDYKKWINFKIVCPINKTIEN